MLAYPVTQPGKGTAHCTHNNACSVDIEQNGKADAGDEAGNQLDEQGVQDNACAGRLLQKGSEQVPGRTGT